jgi:UDP-4-amino-4,6-dideoxy-N-acetyl-beta-L-altrosamine transaminase
VSEKQKFLPYGKQSLDDADVAAVLEALRSDWLTTGPCVEAFEKALAEYCGAKHAVAVCNGTAALHVAMLAAGIGPGDRVLTSTNTFLASANCAVFAGATADFADIDAGTYNVTAETLEHAWKPDVRAVIPVDFAGRACEMPAIAELARSHNALVIEDASHAIGSECHGQRVGGHPWAGMTTFSFHPVKTITTGEGGAILTNNDDLAQRCRTFRNHGMRRVESAGPWYYEMAEVGYNYRITDLQCALGLSQLKKLNRFVARRKQIVDAYNAAFASLLHATTPYAPTSATAWHLYVLQIDFAALGKTRTQVMSELRKRGVGTQVHYIPVHLQPYYRDKYGYGPGKCLVAEAYYQRCLSLPLYPAMTDVDVERVIQAVKEVTQVSGLRFQVSR